MQNRVPVVRRELSLTVVAAVLFGGSATYVAVNRGSVLADLAETIAPLGGAVGLVWVAINLSGGNSAPETVTRTTRYAWLGAVRAAAVGGWWVVVSLSQWQPVVPLGDQILTVMSLGAATGVGVGDSAAERPRERRGDRPRVLAEATWTERAGHNPILLTITDLLADLRGTDPVAIDPLYDDVDPECSPNSRRGTAPSGNC